METKVVKIKDIFNIEKGLVQSSKNVAGQYNFITGSSDWKTHNEYSHDCEALVYVVGAAGSLGRTHYVKGKFIASDLCFVLTPKKDMEDKVNLKYYYYYFNLYKDTIVKKIATGTSKLAINRKNFSNYKIVLSDIKYQNAFVEKIEKIEPINNKLKEVLEKNVSYINKLRQSILQEAVQGKLVPQDPNDEPASVLLEKIKKEKERLIKEKKIKKEKPLPPITEDEIPYELPKGWEWVRLGEIGVIVGGGTPKTNIKEYWENGDIPWLTPADLNGLKGKYISKGRRNITKLGLEKSSAQLMPKGTVLFSSRAPIGYTAIANNPLSTNQGFKSCIPYIVDMSEYIYYYLTYSAQMINEQASGTTFKEVSGSVVAKILFPLPPLNEQKRIVEKIDKLMALCDELEKNIEQSKKDSELLMQSVLKEAFKGA